MLCHQIADGITAVALYLSIQTYNKNVVSYSLYFCWYLCMFHKLEPINSLYFQIIMFLNIL